VNYVQKDRLISPARYADLEQRLRQQLNKSSNNLEDMKQLLATRPEFMQFCFDNTPSEHSANSSVTVKLRQIQVVGQSEGHDATDAEIQGLSSIYSLPITNTAWSNTMMNSSRQH
jgi:hypothetical protein